MEHIILQLRDQFLQDNLYRENFYQHVQELLEKNFIPVIVMASTARQDADLQCAEMACKLSAKKIEIWGEHLGFYTADPQLICTSRLLRFLDYTEAQELASLGIEIIDPKSLTILQENSISLEMYSYKNKRLGTQIGHFTSSEYRRVKALTLCYDITLIALEGISMWQQVGFLAKVFAIFAKHNLSIDLVTTSQSNVTVSLERGIKADLESLLTDLAQYCKPKIIAPCAAISLVGQKMRSNLHRLGPILELFEEEKVHLLSQASSDLNLTFVVDDNQALRLFNLLHAQLFSGVQNSQLFGSSFQQEAKEDEKDIYKDVWWVRERSKLLELPTPAYVYNQESLLNNVKQLQSLTAIDKIFFAMKANSNTEILKLFQNEGIGFECVSIGEVQKIRSLFPTLESDKILFTPNFADKDDFFTAFQLKATVTLDSYAPLELWPEIFREREVFLRLDLGHGAGHHKKVRTAGSSSKFGIPVEDIPRVKELAERLNVKVIGLHSHSGSGIKDASTWYQTAQELSQYLKYFPYVGCLDLGGGLGVAERRDLDSFDLQALNDRLLDFKREHPELKICIEPGRFLVAQAGIILTKACQIKEKGSKKFVGCNAGMNVLIRPALYGAYHEIVNLSRWGKAKDEVYDIVGPICESGDVLGRERTMTETNAGDILLIDTAGAYGYTMSSEYNLRPKVEEIMI